MLYLIKYGCRLHKMLQSTISITKLKNGFIPSEVSQQTAEDVATYYLYNSEFEVELVEMV